MITVPAIDRVAELKLHSGDRRSNKRYSSTESLRNCGASSFITVAGPFRPVEGSSSRAVRCAVCRPCARNEHLRGSAQSSDSQTSKEISRVSPMRRVHLWLHKVFSCRNSRCGGAGAPPDLPLYPRRDQSRRYALKARRPAASREGRLLALRPRGPRQTRPSHQTRHSLRHYQ